MRPLKMHNNSKDKTPKDQRVLKNIPFFAELSSMEIAEIECLIIKKRVAKGEVILFEEDTTNYMYIIFLGKVRVVQLSDDGREHILAIHKKWDYFGEMSLFDGKTQPATVIAMEDSEIGLLSKQNFERFVLKNEKMLYQFVYMLCLRLRESWLMLKIMSFSDAEQRVRATLRNIGQLYGIQDKRGVLVALKLTHQDIANYAAVSRETVSRLLGRFIRQGEIEIQENKYILIKSASLKNQFLQ